MRETYASSLLSFLQLKQVDKNTQNCKQNMTTKHRVLAVPETNIYTKQNTIVLKCVKHLKTLQVIYIKLLLEVLCVLPANF